MHAFCRRFAVCLAVCLVAASAEAAKQPIKKLKHDPKVPPVALFDAIEAGTIETSVIARNSHEANLFVTNKSNVPVTVQMPQAVVAVQVLKQQFFGQMNRNGINGPGLQAGNMMGGGAQSLGMGQQNMFGNNGPGGFNNGPGGMNNFPGNGFNNIGVGNGFGPGNGLFTVPPQKTAQVPMTGVCLAHGKPDPSPRMTYKLVKLEAYTSDPALQETLKQFTSGATDLQSAQAAVWHLTDRMSWDELRGKQIEQPGGLPSLPYFSAEQIDGAETLIREVRQKVGTPTRREERAAR